MQSVNQSKTVDSQGIQRAPSQAAASDFANAPELSSVTLRLRPVKKLLLGTLLNKAYIAETKVHRTICSALQTHARGVVVDVGCGSKPFESQIVRHPAVERYIGVEYPGAVDYFGEPIANVEVFGDAQHLPFCDELADVVLCSQVIEHVPEPELAIQEAYRILRPGGIYILSVPSMFKLHMEPNDFHRFTKYGLRHVLSKTGFEVVEMHCLGKVPAALGQSIALYLYEVLVLRRGTGQPSLWRAPLVLPLLALIQGIALVLDHFARSETLTIGYTVISRKPNAEAPGTY
jgi:SAM-dependent methyltransferase